MKKTITKKSQKIEKEKIKSKKIAQTKKRAKTVVKDKASKILNSSKVGVKQSDKIKKFSSSKVSEKKPKEKIRKVRYFESVGRRKTAVARVRLFTQGEKLIIVNDRPYKDYFPVLEDQQTIIASLEKMNSLGRFFVSVKVRGGGIHAQAEAVRHGIARALLKFNSNFRKKLKKAGFLTRDPRMRERKKFGLKRARRAPQWRKR